MNILVRHTLNSVLRNPVQSLIVVASTAMITACILMCMCISSMFEQIAAQWATRTYAGASVLVDLHSSPTLSFDPALEYIDAHSDEVVGYYFTANNYDDAVFSDTASARAMGVGVYNIDYFDSITGSKALARRNNDTEYPSVHISNVLADVAGLSVGDTLSLKDGTVLYVESVMNPAGRYFDQLVACFVYELPEDTAPDILYLYLKDPLAITPSGKNKSVHWRDVFREMYGITTSISSDGGYTDALIEESVGGSMQLMTVAAAVISVVMACLLFSSFSVIVRGRVNELVKFKAAGATPAQSAFILILEAAVYALIGGLIGLGVGEGLIQYLNSLLGELIVGATLATPAYKYIAALFIGAGCGLAACALPCVRMSRKSIQSLIGGDERMTRKPPLLVAVLLTLLTVACGVSLFFVDGMTLNVLGILLIALTFVWIITSMPHFLAFAARAAAKLSRHGAAYVAMCAAPRNASVSSSLTMLAALITFITLGTGIIDMVGLTSVPSSVRYGNADAIISIQEGGGAYATAERVAAEAETLPGAYDAAILTMTGAGIDISRYGETPADDGLLISYGVYTVPDENDLRFVCPSLTDEEIRLFAETEHPVILPQTVAGREGLSVGDEVSVWITAGYTATSFDIQHFTVVAIDDTVTSWDDFVLIRRADCLIGGWSPSAEILVLLDSDPAAFTDIRAALDAKGVTVYTYSGYFSAEGTDKLDTEDLIGMFTFIIYGIAGLGLVNLIVITAGSRKKEFDVLRLAGLTPAGAAAYISAETGVLAAVGFSVGLVAAFFANRASAAIARLIGEYFTPEAFPTFMIAIAAALTAVFILLWALSHATSFLQVSSPRYRTRDDRSLRAN